MGVRTSILDGVDITYLESRLSAMQIALLDLQSGEKVVTASYQQGEGNRSVTYRQSDIGSLTQAIITVQAQIDRLNGNDGINRRKSMKPFF